MTGYIYALGDPEVRYVGQTVDLQRRFYTHVYNVVNSQLGRWLQELRATDRKPQLFVVETLEFEVKKELLEREKFWIRHFKDLGFDLLNSTVGGGNDMGFLQSRNNSHRKLTNNDIAEIRKRCPYPGAYSYTLLAQELGVNRSTVSRVVRKKSFRDYLHTPNGTSDGVGRTNKVQLKQ